MASSSIFSLAVADAGWFTTENLFLELDRPGVSLLLLKCLDYLNGHRKGLYPWSSPCRLRRRGENVWERQLLLPSGWMKSYPRIGMRPIARAIRRWRGQLADPGRLALVMTYPHYLHLKEQLRPDVSIYYNVDDYTLYWPRQAARITALEHALVREADLTLCVSRLRASELRAAVPEAADRIHHEPHGAPTPFLAARPLGTPAAAPGDLASLPRPILGYIGSLEDRVDWELMDRLALRFPQASIVVLGRRTPPGPESWRSACERFLARPNVHAIGWRGQDQLPAYSQAFDVALIPYLIDHPFNRACCPTKIMDAMAATRPIVSTAIPECLLHAERFDVAETHAQFLDAVASILARGSDDGRAEARYRHALENTCRRVAGRILDRLRALEPAVEQACAVVPAATPALAPGGKPMAHDSSAR